MSAVIAAVSIAVHGAASTGEKAALVVLALLVAAAVLYRGSRRLRACALVAAGVLTPVLLAVDIWDTAPMRHLRAHPPLAAAAVVLGLAAIAALAAGLHRHRWAFPLAAVLVLPFRVPISTVGTTANLLVPLYLVVAAAVVEQAYRWLREGESPVEIPGETPAETPREALGKGPGDSPAELAGGTLGEAPGETARESQRARRIVSRIASPRTAEWALMAVVVAYACQATYSADFSKAFQNMVFFYVPFALMLSLLREVRFTPRLLAGCAALTLVLAVAFTAVGLVEYQSKSLILDPSLAATDMHEAYFRVNSLFFDPNIYGRYLALAMILLATAVLWSRRPARVLGAAAVLAWLWWGLLVSFSQSSMAAIVVGLVVVAAFRWRARYVLGAAGALLAVALALLLVGPSSLHFGLRGSGGSLNNATSGRGRLIEGGARLFADRPAVGFGAGSFAVEYRSHQQPGTATATSASHTTPVTVAAEQGALGLVLYVALLLSCLATVLVGAGRSPPRIAIAACFIALVVHTMAYADFLEDPTTWVLLGIGFALAAGRSRAAGNEDRGLAAAPVGRASAVPGAG